MKLTFSIEISEPQLSWMLAVMEKIRRAKQCDVTWRRDGVDTTLTGVEADWLKKFRLETPEFEIAKYQRENSSAR